VLILTNSVPVFGGVESSVPSHVSARTGVSTTSTLESGSVDSNEQRSQCNKRLASSAFPANPEELPEDLEGIDVDPNVRCDVVAVIKYEQNLGRIPKLEPT